MGTWVGIVEIRSTNASSMPDSASYVRYCRFLLNFSTLVKEVFFFESSNSFVVEYPKFLLEPEGHSFDCCSEN